MYKLGKSTSAKKIVQLIQDDFGITVDKETAQAIKAAHANGCLMWDATKIVTTDSSRIRILKDEDGRIESSVDYKPYR